MSSARIAVDEETVGEIGPGLLALVGVGREDDLSDAEELAKKIVHLRVFADADGRMNRSLLDCGYSLALVSQFTLYGDARKGRRPYFGAAAPPRGCRSFDREFGDRSPLARGSGRMWEVSGPHGGEPGERGPSDHSARYQKTFLT